MNSPTNNNTINVKIIVHAHYIFIWIEKIIPLFPIPNRIWNFVWTLRRQMAENREREKNYFIVCLIADDWTIASRAIWRFQ